MRVGGVVKASDKAGNPSKEVERAAATKDPDGSQHPNKTIKGGVPVEYREGRGKGDMEGGEGDKGQKIPRPSNTAIRGLMRIHGTHHLWRTTWLERPRRV